MPDFSKATSTKPFKTGTVLPSTCTVGETFFKSNASAGQNIYICTATNTWTAVAGSAHAATHATGGSDPVTAESVGAQPALGFTAENSSNRGLASGYAPLDPTARVPQVNLPADPLFNSLRSGDGSAAGELRLYEKSSEGNSYVSWLAPDGLNATSRFLLPSTTPAAGQILQIGSGPDANGIVPLILDTHLRSPSVGTTAWTQTYVNDTVTGTVDKRLVKLTGSGKAVVSAGSTTVGIVGICQSGCGATGSAEIAVRGRASCTFDNATVEGDYVQADGSTGKCHDAGSSYPATSGTIVGRVLESGSAGDHEIQIGVGPEAQFNATRLQNRSVSSTAPSDGQVLQWSTGNSQWEPTNRSAGAGTVTSVDAGGGVQTESGSAITASGKILGAEPVNTQTGSSYRVVNEDRGKLIVVTNSGGPTMTLPAAGSSGQFAAGWYVDVRNSSAAAATLVVETSLLDGASSSLQLQTNQGVRVVSDGSAYYTVRGISTGSGGGTLRYQSIKGMSALGVSDNTETLTARPTVQLGSFLSASDDSTNTWTQINTDFMDMRSYAVQDHFLNYSSTAGALGELGWTFGSFAGTNSVSKPFSGAWPWLGGIRITVGSSSPAQGNGGGISLAHNTGQTNLGELGTKGGWAIAFAFRLNSTANSRFRLGVTGSPTTVGSYSSMGLRYDTNSTFGDTVFQFFVRGTSGSEVTFAVPGNIADTNAHTFLMRSTVAGIVSFSLDGGSEVTACAAGANGGGNCNITVTMPTAGMDPILHLLTDTTASKSADLFEFRFQAKLSTQTGNKR